jgi:hypothetical protein
VILKKDLHPWILKNKEKLQVKVEKHLPNHAGKKMMTKAEAAQAEASRVAAKAVASLVEAVAEAEAAEVEAVEAVEAVVDKAAARVVAEAAVVEAVADKAEDAKKIHKKKRLFQTTVFFCSSASYLHVIIFT